MDTASVTPVAGIAAAIGPGWAVLPLHAVVPVTLPEWTDAECRILASPALGARFTHHHFTVRTGGGARAELAPHLEGWCWVLEGEIRFDLNGLGHRLARGSFVYLPPGARYGVEVPGEGAEVLVHVRAFEPLAGHAPDSVVENPVRLPGAPGARALVPEQPAWDVTVSAVARAAGERGAETVHAFEQALWVLDGEGTIALAGHERPLRRNTFVWLGAFQPAAIHAGETPLHWIESRSANRDVAP